MVYLFFIGLTTVNVASGYAMAFKPSTDPSLVLCGGDNNGDCR
jgi:hypothetical protein